MSILFYFIWILFSFGQLQRISLYNRQINFYLYELFLIIFLLVLFLKYKIEPLKYFLKNYKQFYLFPLILFLSLIFQFNQFSNFQNLVGFLYFFRLFFYFLYFIYLFYFVKINPTFKNTIKNSLNIFIFLTITSTTIQYFLYPDLRNLMYLGWDPHLMRTFGVFFDTSIAAIVYGLVFFITESLIIKFIFLIFLILSFSRSVILSFIFALGYSIYKEKKSALSLMLIVFFIIVSLILTPKPFGEGAKLTRTFTIISRINDYKEGLNLFFKRPFFGWGYNRLRYVRDIIDSNAASNFSSSYLTVLAASGISGLSGLLVLIYFFWKKFHDKRVIFIFIGLASFFDNIFLHPFILFLIFSSLFDK